MRLANALVPNLSGRMMNRFLRRYFGQADAAPVSEGNLFRSPFDDGRIDGGFRRQDDRNVATAVLGLAGAAALAIVLLRRAGRGRRW